MFARRAATALVATSMLVTPVQRASAGDEGIALIGGLLIGGIIAHEVTKNNMRKQQAAQQAAAQQARSSSATTSSTTRSSGVSTEQRAANAEVQNALNYFGYDVGAADGILGRNSRAGIARFQTDMQVEADGTLSKGEQEFLLTSYERADAASTVAPYNEIVATQGRKGLLMAFRREAAGQPATVQSASASSSNVTSAAPGAAKLPNFGSAPRSGVMAAFCNQTAVLTATNGGMVQPGQGGDRKLALAEQFCTARTHAIGDTAELEAQIAGQSPEQIEAECSGISGVMAPYVAQLTLETPQRVLADVGKVLSDSGQSTDELQVAGRVCLGAGYRADDAQMALGSALIVAGLGEHGYAEMVSHHLREGFGVDRSAGAASDWMAVAVKTGQTTPALGQDQPRLAMLREAGVN